MYSWLFSKILTLYQKPAPAVGIGLFRCLFGLVTLQEILFLIFFNHLIFDPIPYLDVEFPLIPLFLWLWAAIALCLALGYQSRAAAAANYGFWLIFVNFTPMQRDFDGGFDLFMIGANFFLLFMPLDRALALDGLREKWRAPFFDHAARGPRTVSALAYVLPVAICLGLLYFDSAVHKLFAPHWRNGLGGWLPSSMPYYISALDMSWLLDQEGLQKFIGYTIVVFQLTFLPGFYRRGLRPWFFAVGVCLHVGITLSFNIYPFGLGMLIFYALMAPFAWYRALGRYLRRAGPRLTVYFDGLCPLCRRTVLAINHFDVCGGVTFLTAQEFAAANPALRDVEPQTLLTDLYAVDAQGRVFSGVDAYARILIAVRYLAALGWLLQAPGLHELAGRYYRNIADNRLRVSCDAACLPPDATEPPVDGPARIFEAQEPRQARRMAHRIAKCLVLVLLLQLNSTVHYGLLYRLHVDTRENALTSLLNDMSNALVLCSGSFLGITPHALYLHDHFAGYEHIIGLTYVDSQGRERWLPFVNEQGRLLAPNWGRVHSMWANIAVTPKIDEFRLKKFIMKVTAFWGVRSGLDLQQTQFLVKMKKIRAPEDWEKSLRNKNLSGDWQTIGTVRWRGREALINLPEDIDAL